MAASEELENMVSARKLSWWPWPGCHDIGVHMLTGWNDEFLDLYRDDNSSWWTVSGPAAQGKPSGATRCTPALSRPGT